MQNPRDYLAEVGKDLASLTSREEQLLTLRDYGEQLSPMKDALMTEENRVPGCASATYVVARLQDDGMMHFDGYSQSFISNGYIFILTEAFNGAAPEEIVRDAESYVTAFAEQAGVRLSMVQSRANAFERIFHYMRKKTVEAIAARQQQTS